jgi:hypothetical protein
MMFLHGKSPRSITERRLQVSPSAKPRKQKLHKMFVEKDVVAKAEVHWSLDTGFKHEAQYPTWLANVVMVKNKNGK